MAVTWGIKRKVWEVYINLQVLAGCPPYRLSMCLCITRNHLSDQAMLLVASMEKEVGEYVATCKVCAHEVSQHPPPGLLHPLPVPHRPWWDIHWTSSQGCPHLKVTPPFSQWLTDFPRGCISFQGPLCQSVSPPVTISKPDRASQPGAGDQTALPASSEPHLLVQASHLGGVRS